MSLFSPAIALFDRLGYRSKFTVFGLVMLIPSILLAAMLTRSMYEDYSFANHEKNGLAVLQPAHALLYELALRRGEQSAHSQQAKEFAVKVDARDQKVQAALAKLVAADKAAGLDTAIALQELQKKLAKMPAPLLDGAENRANNEALIGAVLNYIGVVAEKSNLILDPEAETYYLADGFTNALPQVVRAASEIRDIGAGALARGFPATGDREALAISLYNLPTRLDALNNDLDHFEKIFPEEKAKLQGLRQTLMNSAAKLSAVYGKEVVNTMAYTMVPKDFLAQADQFDNAVLAISQFISPSLEKGLDKRMISKRTELVLGLALILIAIVLAFYLFVAAYLSIARAIQALEQVTSDLAAGKLSARAKLSTKDETARVAESFNRMAGQFASVLHQAKQAAVAVSGATTRLVSDSSLVAQGAQQQSDAVYTASDNVRDLEGSITTVNSRVQQTVNLTREASQLAEKGQISVKNVETDIQDVAMAVRQVSGTVEELSKQSANIGQIVSVIKEVADQTNLLALNAAIEAARAGEQGRGFAVVADEVRKLAERTGRATQEIHSNIIAMQDKVKQTVVTMEAGQAKVDQCEDRARAAAEVLTQIRDQSKAAELQVKEIASVTDDQAKSGEAIANQIQLIADLASSNKSTVGNTVSAVNEMKDKAIVLTKAIEHFEV